MSGLGQLSLVEHALCPLDPRTSLRSNLVFETGYEFTDTDRRRQTARTTVLSPLGLSASDEFYLWGLLALTFGQPEPDGELHATPHFILRRLGVIDQSARRGGRQYQLFGEAIERLSAVRYRNDRFYDPVRAEHRKVAFGFLSYSLPVDPASNRAWRFAWDPIFFECISAAGGYFHFDLATYRSLDPAARRLFLFLSKVFSRRLATPRLNLRHLGEHLLGFSSRLSTPDMKLKISRLVQRLADLGVVAGKAEFRKEAKGLYTLILDRGPYFAKGTSSQNRTPDTESPLWDPLLGLGFEADAVLRLMKRFPHARLREWIDITLAAKERFGDGFFSRSPQAFLVDNLKASGEGKRTPPDWWHEVRKAELARSSRQLLQNITLIAAPPSDAETVGEDSRRLFEKVRGELFGQFREAGYSEPNARGMAERFAREHVKGKGRKASEGLGKIDSLISIPSKQ